jgi:hypothetical protein
MEYTFKKLETFINDKKHPLSKRLEVAETVLTVVTELILEAKERKASIPDFSAEFAKLARQANVSESEYKKAFG